MTSFHLPPAGMQPPTAFKPIVGENQFKTALRDIPKPSVDLGAAAYEQAFTLFGGGSNTFGIG